MAQVGQYQIGSFASPVNGGPLDATVVRGNDNALVGVHDNHDNDPTIHVQSFPFASLPSASTLGRFLIANDTFRAYFDTGSVLQELAYLSKAGGTLTGAITVPGVQRVTGTGGAEATTAAWRFGDTNSASSRDWSISNGFGAGAADIGVLDFCISAAASGDPLANTGTKILRLTSGGIVITGSVTASTTITAASFIGPLTGNASTATALQTARTINGVSFDGTANITVAAAAGTLTGGTLASGVTASSLTSVGTLTNLAVAGATTTGKVKGGSSTPTLSNQLAGSSPTISGSDLAMIITFTVPGPGITLGTRICTVTFSSTYGSTPIVSPTNNGVTGTPAAGPSNTSATAYDVYPAIAYSAGVAGNSYSTNFLVFG